MRSFFQALQQLHNKGINDFKIEETPEFMALAPAFLRFCNQDLLEQSEEAVLQELTELLCIPGITHVAFLGGDESLELLLGTVHVFIEDPRTHKEYDIGEFIIRINPPKKSILFTNITSPLIVRDPGEGISRYHHPHVYENGKMCIEMNMLYEYLAEYKIASLARVLVRALHTVDDVPIPDAKLMHWPQKGKAS